MIACLGPILLAATLLFGQPFNKFIQFTFLDFARIILVELREHNFEDIFVDSFLEANHLHVLGHEVKGFIFVESPTAVQVVEWPYLVDKSNNLGILLALFAILSHFQWTLRCGL